MTKKKISFKKKDSLSTTPQIDPERALDNWVMGSTSKEEALKTQEKETVSSKEDMYKFTMVMPTYLHRRIKKSCAIEGVSMKEKIIEIFEQYFPES